MARPKATKTEGITVNVSSELVEQIDTFLAIDPYKYDSRSKFFEKAATFLLAIESYQVRELFLKYAQINRAHKEHLDRI